MTRAAPLTFLRLSAIHTVKHFVHGYDLITAIGLRRSLCTGLDASMMSLDLLLVGIINATLVTHTTTSPGAYYVHLVMSTVMLPSACARSRRVLSASRRKSSFRLLSAQLCCPLSHQTTLPPL
jgi:hypothetical protein